MPNETQQPTPQDVAKFSNALLEDISEVLSGFGLKIAVLHVPIIVPLSHQEAANAHAALEEKMKHLGDRGSPRERDVLALRSALEKTALPHGTLLRDVTAQYLAKFSTPPPPPTEPPSAYPH